MIVFDAYGTLLDVDLSHDLSQSSQIALAKPEEIR